MGWVADGAAGMKKLPTWVFIWINILGMVNMVSLIWIFFNQHPIIVATFIGFFVAFPANLVIIYHQLGASKLLSVPHVVAWVPLCSYLIYVIDAKALP